MVSMKIEIDIFSATSATSSMAPATALELRFSAIGGVKQRRARSVLGKAEKYCYLTPLKRSLGQVGFAIFQEK